MNAMAKLMKVLRDNNPALKQRALGKLTGSNTSTVSRCSRGVSVSLVIAAWVANEYGGECVAWADEVREGYKKSLTYAERKKQAGFFGINVETHHLLPIDRDDILTTLLPVTHPRPVCLGAPSWA